MVSMLPYSKKSFVILANCVASSKGVPPIDTHLLDYENRSYSGQQVQLPDLGEAGRTMVRDHRLYISSMDLCRYYWKDKGIGIYDRQMQSWNAGRRAALREKTKSFVYIEMNMGIEIEWWDVEGILTSTKVLRKFLVEPREPDLCLNWQSSFINIANSMAILKVTIILLLEVFLVSMTVTHLATAHPLCLPRTYLQ